MEIELRNDSVILEGYCNAVERQSKVLPSPTGSFVEVIRQGAFKKSLERRGKVDLLLNHDKERLLGSTTRGNLELYEDNIGLRVKCRVYDQFVIDKAKNNNLRGWSFGFVSKKQTVEERTNEPNIRYIEDLDLFEVSIIDNTQEPAYVGTSIEMRNGKEVLKEIRTLNLIEDIDIKDKDYKSYKNTLEELRGIR